MRRPRKERGEGVCGWVGEWSTTDYNGMTVERASLVGEASAEHRVCVCACVCLAGLPRRKTVQYVPYRTDDRRQTRLLGSEGDAGVCWYLFWPSEASRRVCETAGRRLGWGWMMDGRVCVCVCAT